MLLRVLVRILFPASEDEPTILTLITGRAEWQPVAFSLRNENRGDSALPGSAHGILHCYFVFSMRLSQLLCWLAKRMPTSFMMSEDSALNKLAPKIDPAQAQGAIHSVLCPDYVDLWKHFEKRGDKLKESMFLLVVWIFGIASALLSFAMQQGFKGDSGFTAVKNPKTVLTVSFAGLLVLIYAMVVIWVHGAHISRAFARAGKARSGKGTLDEIWKAGENAHGLPILCWSLMLFVVFFAAAFIWLVSSAAGRL
jgi:hypothetical protein